MSWRAYFVCKVVWLFKIKGTCLHIGINLLTNINVLEIIAFDFFNNFGGLPLFYYYGQHKKIKWFLLLKKILIEYNTS